MVALVAILSGNVATATNIGVSISRIFGPYTVDTRGLAFELNLMSNPQGDPAIVGTYKFVIFPLAENTTQLGPLNPNGQNTLSFDASLITGFQPSPDKSFAHATGFVQEVFPFSSRSLRAGERLSVEIFIQCPPNMYAYAYTGLVDFLYLYV